MADRRQSRLVTRRTFVAKVGVLLGASAALAACSPTAPTAPSGGASSAKPAETTSAQAKAPAAPTSTVTLQFKGWAYLPEYFRRQLDVFEQQYPGIKVNFEAYPNPKFDEIMLTNFVSGVEMDAVFARDDSIAAWVKAGYVQTLEGMPGIDAYKSDMLQSSLDAVTVNGKIYGLPQTAPFNAFIYNEKMLKDAGFNEPPKTWDELSTQALAMKRAGIVEYPFVVLLKNVPGLNWHWWNLVYSRGGSLFDADLRPLFPDKDPAALTALEWVIDGIHNTKIINQDALELDFTGAAATMAAGRGAFSIFQYSELNSLRDPNKSKVADVIRVGRTPGPTPDQYPGSSMAYSRMYSIPATTKKVEAAYKLIQFVGGKDAHGQYYYPKRQWIDNAGGYSYKSMAADPEILEATRKWMDPEVFASGNAKGRARQALHTTWYAEWDQFNATQIQDAVAKRTSPRDALANSAKKAIELAASG